MLTIDGTATPWQRALTSCVFSSEMQGALRRNGLLVRRDEAWMTFEQPVIDNVDALAPREDRYGLWKAVIGQDDRPCYQFQLPAAIVGRDSELDQGEEGPLQASIAWVLATGKGQLPDGWTAPQQSEIEAWIPHGGLSVQRGSFALQGSLICSDDRLKVMFPLGHAPKQLSDNRFAWLRQTLLDAQDRWRMARIVMNDERERTSVVAEVDLSGAPIVILEELFTVGLDALRWVVSWLICPVSLLADPTVQCAMWELPPETFLYGGNRNE